MNASEFIRKWRRVELTERSASQQHFLDLCDLVGHPKPAEVDRTGETFTFEKGAEKQGGGDGFADVWKRDCFGWEYKGRHKDLDAAYKQLLLYREALENPPLLVCCDMDRIVIHTNFTATANKTIELALADLATEPALDMLRAVFTEPDKLRPGRPDERITARAAAHVADLAQALRDRGVEPHRVARFLDRIVFCLFAEDIDLLQDNLFSRILEKTRDKPDLFAGAVGQLFTAMAGGGIFGADLIRRFNGNLFSDPEVIALTDDEIEELWTAARFDWSKVDPSIFGTLFERGMDPAKRSQLGAHYTSRADIETLVEPVVMAPLRREWDDLRGVIDNLLTTGKKKPTAALQQKDPSDAVRRKARGEANAIVLRFHQQLCNVTVLDPACGSGNFLYVTLQKLKDLEKDIIDFAGGAGLAPLLPAVGPWQLYGIEINPYAFDLAQMVVWIGYLQWVYAHGYGITGDPVLRPMDRNFLNIDAILDLTDPAHPKEPEWPRVDYIVGNPPFLGGRRIRGKLGDTYTDALFSCYEGKLPPSSDFCCYWFEAARRQIEKGCCKRAGLLATQGIRSEASRHVLERVRSSGSIFFAQSDLLWVLDGAEVRIAMVAFDDGAEVKKALDGKTVCDIDQSLRTGSDLNSARILGENAGLCSRGSQKRGPFEIPEDMALSMLMDPNPSGRPNSDVIVPFVNGLVLSGRAEPGWIIDFGADRSLEDACQYLAPLAYVEKHVKPVRMRNNDERLREKWWLHGIAQPAMRERISSLDRFCVTVRVAKYRYFVWLQKPCLPDDRLVVVATDSPYMFGVLNSRPHTLWTLGVCAWHGVGNDPTYNPRNCFQPFPFPWPPGQEPPGDPRILAIADAAEQLNTFRELWLKPPEWLRLETIEFPGTPGGPWHRFLVSDRSDSSERRVQPRVATVRYPRLMEREERFASKVRSRTLSRLYNISPRDLLLLQRRLDEAVLAAYGWLDELDDATIQEELLKLNRERGRLSRL